MITSEATGRGYLPGGLLVSNRNRFDFRWIDSGFNWRYRNRLKLERTLPVGRFELTPYAHAEVFRNMEEGRWTRVRYAAGAEWSITRRIVLDST